jgi:uncharacterized protein (DUF697 family)/predicted GTPase
MGKQTVDLTLVEDLLNKTQEEIKNMTPVNVMLVGKTGVGKSTLVNNIFREKLATTGVGKPVTKHLRRIQKEGVPIVLYDTRGLELSETVQSDVRKEIIMTINEKKSLGIDQAIHVAYYCINANSSRIEEAEINFINELAQLLPVIVVLTQAMGQHAEVFKTYIDQLNLHIVGVLPIMAETFIISETMTIPQSGLKELIALTFDVLPEDSRKAFINAQQVDIERKAKAARRWARSYVATTFGVGFVPIPFSDATLLVPMQITMMSHITAIFGVSLDRASVATILGAIGGTSGATYLGRYIVSNLVKLIPGAGTVAGGIISGTTASVLTSALAMSYIEVLTLMAKRELKGEAVSLSEISQAMKENLQSRLKKQETKEEQSTNKGFFTNLVEKIKRKRHNPS